VITAAAAAGFLVAETRAAEPILPLHVFRNRNFSVTMALTFLTGLAMFGAMTFLPLYQQTVQGASAVVSGLMLTPMMVGVTITSIVSGQLTTKTGRYKLFPVFGGAIMTVGLFLLTRLGADTSRLTSGFYYVVLGLGMGFLMQMVSLIAQNSVEPRDMGVASSARMFFQQIGGSLGVSAFGAVFASRLTGSLRAAVGPGGAHINVNGGQLDPTVVNKLPAPIKHDVFYAIAHAIQGVFLWTAPFGVLIFVLALLIKEVPLRGRTPAQGAGETPSQQAELVS
jgi:MFS family permease